jgi:hypothetical protein
MWSLTIPNKAYMWSRELVLRVVTYERNRQGFKKIELIDIQTIIAD